MAAMGIAVSKKPATNREKWRQAAKRANTIPARYPSGKKKALPENPNVYVLAHRVYDNWGQLRRLGYNEDFGSAIGKLYMFGAISAREATAGRIYAQTAARYDRFNGLTRQAKSPAYMRASRGHDDTVDKVERAGTVQQYEKSARRAKKNWLKIASSIPNPSAHRLLDEVCIYDIYPIDERSRSDIKTLLGVVAGLFGIKYEDD
jgi:hypothetical protein